MTTFSDNFLKAINLVLDMEGRYLEFDKSDSGGTTFCGIAYNFHKEWRGWDFIDKSRANSSSYSKELVANEELMNLVYDYYHKTYWKKYDLESMPYNLAFELFEQMLNMGEVTSLRFMQRILNACNYNKRYGEDLVVDGKWGKLSKARLKAVLEKVGPNPLVLALNCMQGSRYLEISETKKSNRKFFVGWLKRVFI